jgi:hypothetical protein
MIGETLAETQFIGGRNGLWGRGPGDGDVIHSVRKTSGKIFFTAYSRFDIS